MIEVELPDGTIAEIETDDENVARKTAGEFWAKKTRQPRALDATVANLERQIPSTAQRMQQYSQDALRSGDQMLKQVVPGLIRGFNRSVDTFAGNPVVAGINAVAGTKAPMDYFSTVAKRAFPEGETPAARYVGAVAEEAGAGAPFGAASHIIRGAASPYVLDAGRALMQDVLAAGGAGIASQGVKEGGGTERDAAIAGLAGGIGVPLATNTLPDLAHAAGQLGRGNLGLALTNLLPTSLARKLAPPGTAQHMKDFKDAGLSPRLGETSTDPDVEEFTNMTRYSPIGGVRLEKKLAETPAKIQSGISATADQIGTVPRSPEELGRSIQHRASSQLTKIKTEIEGIEDEIGKQVKNAPVVPMTLLTKINELRSGLQGKTGEELTKGIDKRFDDILGDYLAGDFNWQTARGLRTFLGDAMRDAKAMDDTSKGIVKALYGALTKDMENSVPANFKSRWSELRNREKYLYGKEGSKVATEQDAPINTLNELLSEDGARALIKKFVEGGTRDATDLKRMEVALGKNSPEWQNAKAFLVDKLGRNAAGEFSFAKMTKDYEALTPEVKQILLAQPGTRDAVDRFNRISQLLQHKSHLYDNNSRTTRTSNASYLFPYLIGAIRSVGVKPLMNPEVSEIIVRLAERGNFPGMWENNLRRLVEIGNSDPRVKPLADKLQEGQ